MQDTVKEVIFGLKSSIDDVVVWNEFHRHDDVQLGFYEVGPVLYQVGKKTYIVEDGDCIMCWSGVPHMVRKSPKGNKQYWITAPLDLFIKWRLPRQYTTAILSGELLTVKKGQCKLIDKMMFKQWIKDLNNPDEGYRNVVEISFESRFRRFCLDYMNNGVETNSIYYENNTSFTKIFQYITDNFRENIKIDDIAKNTMLNSSYAMSVFKKNCGYTINTMITMMRINEAQRLLSTTELSILEVSLQSGFQTISNFYSSFKKNCGKTPKEFRRTSFIL